MRLRNLAPGSLRRRVVPLMFRSRASLQMSAADRTFLRDYYRDDIKQLAALVGRDLSAWL